MKKLVLSTLAVFVVLLIAAVVTFYTPLVIPRFIPDAVENRSDQTRVTALRIGGLAAFTSSGCILRHVDLALSIHDEDCRVRIDKLVVPEPMDFVKRRDQGRLIVSGLDLTADVGGLHRLDGHFYLTSQGGRVVLTEGVFRNTLIRILPFEMTGTSGRLRGTGGKITLTELSGRVSGRECRGRVTLDYNRPVHYQAELRFAGLRPGELKGIPALVSGLSGPMDATLEFSGTRLYPDVRSLTFHIPPGENIGRSVIGEWIDQTSNETTKSILKKLLGNKSFITIDRGEIRVRDTADGQSVLVLDIIGRADKISLRETIPLPPDKELWANFLSDRESSF